MHQLNMEYEKLNFNLNSRFKVHSLQDSLMDANNLEPCLSDDSYELQLLSIS